MKISNIINIDDSYKEGPLSTFTHNGKQYQLDSIFHLTKHRSFKNIRIDELDWILQYDQPDVHRVEKADISVPIIVLLDSSIGHTGKVVVDGLHRLTKAKKEGKEYIKAKIVYLSEISQYEIHI